jgi:hypothetical protein
MSGGESIALKVDRILNKVIHLLGVLHLLVSPYTKVEESFNLQVNRILHSFQHLPSLWVNQCCGSESGFTGSICFGPPGSISQRYGSLSFYHRAKIVRKTLILTAL